MENRVENVDNLPEAGDRFQHSAFDLDRFKTERAGCVTIDQISDIGIAPPAYDQRIWVVIVIGQGETNRERFIGVAGNVKRARLEIGVYAVVLSMEPECKIVFRGCCLAFNEICIITEELI